MNVSDIPQREALKLQLAAIAGNDPHSSYFEIRSKNALGRMSQLFIPVREIDRAASAIQNRGQVGDTWIGACTRTREAGDKNAVDHGNALWCDLDDPAALSLLADFRPLPTIVNRTGTPGHALALWALREPAPAAWIERGCKRLAKALQGDPKSTDAARIIRPARTFNFKHHPPALVLCTRLELDVFTFAQVVGHLGDDRPYVPVARPKEIRSASPSKVLDGLAKFVSQAAPDSKNRNSSLFWAACRLRERVDDCQINETVGRHALLAAALTTGLSETEIERTLDSALARSRAAA